VDQHEKNKVKRVTHAFHSTRKLPRFRRPSLWI
jgi:hypothetical protein